MGRFINGRENKMINWMNDNQGFIMGILTLVYVGATVLIWLSNKKSANAASKQLKEMESTQQQNVRLQLFKRRYDIHDILTHWFSVGEDVFANLNTDKKLQDRIRKEEFDVRVFRTYHRLNVQQCSDEIKKIITRLDETEGTRDQKTDVEQLRELQKQLSAYLETLDLYYDDYYKLDFLKFYYIDIDFGKLKCFADAFYNMVKNNSSENLQILEQAFNAVDKDNTLRKMKEQMIVLKPS